MANFNQVTLLGNVGRDPDVRTFESGNRAASFSLATTFRFKNAAGELSEDTSWHNIVANGKLAETVEGFVRKGMTVLVNGRIRYRSYTNSAGEEKNITEIVANAIQLIGTRPEADMGTRPAAPAKQTAQAEKAAPVPEGDGLPF